MWRSLMGFQAGDLVSTEMDARAALTIAQEIEQSVGVPIATATLAGSLIEQGHLPAALEILEAPSLGLDLLVEENRQATMTLIVRGTARLLAGRIDEAVADLDRVARLSSALGDRNPAFGGEWRAAHVPALLAADRIAEARDRAEENLLLARAWGAARSVGLALRISALTESDRGRRLAHLEEAVATLQRSPARLEHARSLVSLGSELRRQGKRTHAREPLRQGLDLAAERGAQGLAEFARAELVAAGARPRRERIAGPDALTASERRVAELAASGLSNREIAQTLFVTIKAVGYHLTNCYRKLDIQGREQLTPALNQPPPRH
jgi:DNA-binding CsgD family transcriptional regulator